MRRLFRFRRLRRDVAAALVGVWAAIVACGVVAQPVTTGLPGATSTAERSTVPAAPAPPAAPAVPAVTAVAPVPSAGATRPRVGLVLGGGGARGAAHIGVLEVLERLRVPVDCVAGTSMGALVAGAWAAGLSPARMRIELGRANWADMFLDSADFQDLNLRSKRLAQRYVPGSELGVQGGGVVGPPGVLGGEKIKLFFNRLVHADAGEPLIENLPLPLSIVATDIGTGERVVFRDGSLTMAMRASMSVPGLMAPVEYRGRKLVDGGLVDNVPIREVRERCGAEVVIAVNVGTPPLKPEEISGLLSVTAQMVALLTEQNVQISLATLKPDDIYMRPDLGTIGPGDFERHEGAAERGRTAAEGVAARLAELSVDEARFAAWERRRSGRERAVPRIDEVQVVGLERVNEAVVRRHLTQPEGAPLDVDRLETDVLRIYGDGWYESVDYMVLRERTRQMLRVMPVEKGWGPDYLRFGLQLDSNLGQGSSFQLRGAYHKTWINRLGGELLFTAEIGNSAGLGVEWYQPVTADGRWFADSSASSRIERTDYWYQDRRVAQYRSRRTALDLRGGANLLYLGEMSAGWRATRVTNEIETGIDVFTLLPSQRSNGWVAGLEFDRFDALHFPSRGWRTSAEWFHSSGSDYSRADLDLRGAWPWQDLVFGARATWVGSPMGQLPVHDAGRLGGFLHLTSFSTGQLIGDDVAFAQLRAERIIGRLPIGLRGDMRLGVALEAGKVAIPYSVQQKDGWLGSLALYLGGETPLGPVYLGLGVGSSRTFNAYFFVGTP